MSSPLHLDAFGDRGNPYTLWTAAQAVFEQGQGGAQS
jgi:hypothetical protein